MKYDFAKDTMEVDGQKLPLKPYRKWLFANHEQLVTSHFIKSIVTAAGIKKTYDWQTIYFTAEQYLFLNEYIKTI